MGISEQMAKERRRMAGDGEPLFTKQRNVVDNCGSQYINLTSEGSQILRTEVGEQMTVNVYPDRIVICREE